MTRLPVFIVAIALSSINSHGAEESPAKGGDASAVDRLLEPAGRSAALLAQTTPQMARSWGEAMSEHRRAVEKRDHVKAIELMNLLLRQNLSKRQAAIALTNRGNSYAETTELDKAMHDYDQALRFDPQYPLAYGARGTVWAKKGDFDAALADFNEIIAMDPKLPRPYLSRGAIFARRHQSREALADFDKAIQLDPRRADPYRMRAAIYLRERQNEKAIAEAARALAIDPLVSDLYFVRAYAYVRTNRLAEARKELARVTRLKLKEPWKALNGLAWVKATCEEAQMRDGKEAVKLATQACEMTNWKNSRPLDTLAASYAEFGDFDAAVRYQQQAIDHVESDRVINLPDMNERLAFYGRHEPYRDPLEM